MRSAMLGLSSVKQSRIVVLLLFFVFFVCLYVCLIFGFYFNSQSWLVNFLRSDWFTVQVHVMQ